MLEIDKYFIDTIKADATLDTLLGSDASDSRIYAWMPAINAPFSATKKAAIFFNDTQDQLGNDSSFPKQIGDMHYYFQAVAIEKDRAKQVAERLIALFGEKETGSGFTTTNYKIGIVLVTNNADGPNEGTPTMPLYSRNVAFFLKEVFKRT